MYRIAAHSIIYSLRATEHFISTPKPVSGSIAVRVDLSSKAKYRVEKLHCVIASYLYSAPTGTINNRKLICYKSNKKITEQKKWKRASSARTTCRVEKLRNKELIYNADGELMVSAVYKPITQTICQESWAWTLTYAYVQSGASRYARPDVDCCSCSLDLGFIQTGPKK